MTHFDTFLTLRAGRPGSPFLRLFGDFGAWGCRDSCIWRFPSQTFYTENAQGKLHGLPVFRACAGLIVGTKNITSGACLTPLVTGANPLVAERAFPQKNPRAHKNKIGSPPPKTQNAPPSKTRNFMDMEVFLQKESKNSRRP